MIYDGKTKMINQVKKRKVAATMILKVILKKKPKVAKLKK